MSEKAHGLQPWDESHRGLNTKSHMLDVELHVGLDRPELKPVETGPLPPQTTGVASLVIEAGTIRGENRCSPLEAHEFSRGRMSLKVPCLPHGEFDDSTTDRAFEEEET